jgi:hypothetical protein
LLINLSDKSFKTVSFAELHLLDSNKPGNWSVINSGIIELAFPGTKKRFGAAASDNLARIWNNDLDNIRAESFTAISPESSFSPFSAAIHLIIALSNGSLESNAPYFSSLNSLNISLTYIPKIHAKFTLAPLAIHDFVQSAWNSLPKSSPIIRAAALSTTTPNNFQLVSDIKIRKPLESLLHPAFKMGSLKALWLPSIPPAIPGPIGGEASKILSRLHNLKMDNILSARPSFLALAEALNAQNLGINMDIWSLIAQNSPTF